MPPKSTKLRPGGKGKSKDAGNVGKATQSRHQTVYDAVAGRVGPTGWLSQEQMRLNKPTPIAPEEILFRRPQKIRINERNDAFFDIYSADERLSPDQVLPDSDLLKALHAYVSSFYSAALLDQGQKSYRSMDETALLAMGILLEEAARDVLGDNGDMALVEPEGLENGLPESKMTENQIHGRVEPQPTPEPESSTESESEEDQRPKKRSRAKKYDSQI